jgi:ubiquinone/menaquinone biosynthesis C-methylase UbiE
MRQRYPSVLTNGSDGKIVHDAAISFYSPELFMESPLQGITSLSQLLEFPYFEFLACMGEFSLHPQASNVTQEIISAAKVRIGERVLEVGSGNGWTTRLLIHAGAQVTVVEKSRRMLAATVRNCLRAGLPIPKYFLSSAEDLRDLPEATFDFALYERLLGLVEDKRKALDECRRALRPGNARIGVVDLHYVSRPPDELLHQLEEIFSTRIPQLSEQDWKDVFADSDLLHWATYSLQDVVPPTAEQIKNSLSQSNLLSEFPEASESDFEALANKWAQWEMVFAENRKYLRCHVGAWKVQ